MKFENLLLHGLFLACFAASALILAAMLVATPSPTRQTISASILLAAPDSCALPHDGVLCPRRAG